MAESGVPEPINGAGVAKTDPDQVDVKQDPSLKQVGDVAQLPEAEPELVGASINDIDLSVSDMSDPDVTGTVPPAGDL